MTTIQKIASGAGIGALVLGSQFYGDWSARNRADEHAKELAAEIQSVREADAARIAELTLELDMIQSRLGVNAADVKTTQQAAATARQEQERTVAALRKTVDDQKRAVDSLRQESGAKIAEVRDQTSTRIGQVSSEVKTDLNSIRQETTSQFGVVNAEVGGVRSDLVATREDLASSRIEMANMRDSLGRQIAHNSDELAVLKRRGERNYYEFDIKKAKTLERIGGVMVQLNKTDTKGKKFDMTVQIDDNKVQKKGQLVNEPVQFYVGRERLRYELVVNTIDKDRVRGYVSTPKDAEAGAKPLAFK
jgi:regulator of replication initiation timing